MTPVRIVLLLSSALVLGPGPGANAEHPLVVAPSTVLPSCAPTAPLLIEVTTRPGSNGLVDLDYTVTPRLDAAWVRAVVEPSHGGRVVSEQPVSASGMARETSRGGRATVELPEGARAGLHAVEWRVVAHMGLVQPDGTIETLGVEAVVTLGKGALPVEARPVVSGGRTSWDIAARHEGGAR